MKTCLLGAILCVASALVCAADCTAQGIPPRDQWGEKFDSPGSKLTFKETVREVMGDRTVVTYNLFASGLPKDQHYVLCMLGLGKEPQATTDAYLNDDGKVVNVLADPARHVAEYPIDLKVYGSKGEPFRFAIISDDGQLRAFTQIVPFPIEKTNGTCRISAVELGPYYSGVLITVTGLQPNEAFMTETHSENEGGQTNATADAQGTYRAGVFPFVKGKGSGKARFRVSAQSCKVEIEFPWGEGSQKFQ